MGYRPLATIAAILLLVCQPSPADPLPYRFRGDGATSCGQAVHFLATRETDQQSRFSAFYLVEWVWGYLAAYNARGSFDTTNQLRETSSIEPPDEQTVYLFLDGYCHRHPTATVFNGADALIRTLGGKLRIPPGLE